MSAKKKVAILAIGRFSPPHRGHIQLIEECHIQASAMKESSKKADSDITSISTDFSDNIAMAFRETFSNRSLSSMSKGQIFRINTNNTEDNAAFSSLHKTSVSNNFRSAETAGENLHKDLKYPSIFCFCEQRH